MLPFPTAVLGSAFQHGDATDKRVAVLLYGALAALMALAWLALWWHLYAHPHLLDEDTTAGFFGAERMRAVIGVVLYGAGAGAAFIAPMVGLSVFAVLPIFYGLTSAGVSPRWRRTRTAAQG